MDEKADPDMLIILKHSRLMAERLRKQGVKVKFNMSFGPIKKAKKAKRSHSAGGSTDARR